MNVLITNPQEVQAYTIMRCLRPCADRIVLAVGDHSVGSIGFAGMAVYSRFVDRRYDTPAFAGDWLAGRLEAANTPAEEAYIRRIEEICSLEQIDVIYPSLDPEVYLFAKNRQRLAAQGVVAVVPDAEVLRIPMDKALTTKAAQRVGFPCPVTWFPASLADVASIEQTSSPPWIVKPRFTAHGANMTLVERASDLGPAWRKVNAMQPLPIVQDYVPGLQRQNYYAIVARDGAIVTLLSPHTLRTYPTNEYRVATKAAVSASSAPYVNEIRALLRELGIWGSYTIQTKIDPRDGVPKLLEINPRSGQHVWWRTGLGVNEPLICLQIARGEQPTGNFHFRDGVLLLDPYADIFDLYSQVLEAVLRLPRRLARVILRRSRTAAIDSNAAARPRVLRTLRMYCRDYLNLTPKVLGPEVSSLLDDPWPCLQAFWFKFSRITMSRARSIATAIRRREAQPVTE